MKTPIQSLFRPFVVAVVACLAFAACAAPGPKQPLPERVQVTWAPDDQLSEVRDNQIQRGWLRTEDWKKSLSEYLRQRANLVLPNGQRLDVKFDDIKLAGSFEPWRGPNAQDIRFMTDLYPPRATLQYKLIGANGQTIREGQSKLIDMSYLQRTVTTSTDPLRYDKRMLDDWINKEFVRKDV